MPDERWPIIDFHAHMLEDELLKQASGKTVVFGYGNAALSRPSSTNEATFQKMLDPRRQIENMGRRGVWHRLPAVYAAIPMVENGGLMAYTNDFFDDYWRNIVNLFTMNVSKFVSCH